MGFLDTAADSAASPMAVADSEPESNYAHKAGALCCGKDSGEEH